MPILANQGAAIRSNRRTLRYIDAFAGPGRTAEGHPGSPLRALEAAIYHNLQFPVPIHITFIEEGKERFELLELALSDYQSRLRGTRNVVLERPIKGDCVPVLRQMVKADQARGVSFGPALVFLDQFGYSSVPMELVGEIMSNPSCEVLIFFFYKDLNRFITDPSKHPAITTAYGTDAWKEAIQMAPAARHGFMIKMYMEQMKKVGRSDYPWPFVMYDEDSQPMCWLVFGTNNLRGLEEMKRAMWVVDGSGGFSFSDRDGLNQSKLFADFNDTDLADTLARHLDGQTLTVAQIKEYVLVNTAHYKFREILSTMSREHRVTIVDAPPGHRAHTFSPDSIKAKFGGASLFG